MVGIALGSKEHNDHPDRKRGNRRGANPAQTRHEVNPPYEKAIASTRQPCSFSIVPGNASTHSVDVITTVDEEESWYKTKGPSEWTAEETICEWRGALTQSVFGCKRVSPSKRC